MLLKVNSEHHPGGSLGYTEFLVTLYYDVMDLKKGFNMNWIDEDILFLSNGHISAVF